MIALYVKKGFFSERWLTYCTENNLPYKLVNPYSTDIIKDLEGCKYFMWHYDHMEYKDSLFAKELLFAIEYMGIKVFPNFYTSWHFNDKVAQKYLLEAVKAPLVPSYVFYDKKSALSWIEQASFPLVFKLKNGAGSLNVNLLKSKREAIKYISKSFGRGFSPFDYKFVFKERLRKYRLGKASIFSVLKWFLAIFFGSSITKLYGREREYFYVQEFFPNNDFDIRVVVIGNKAFAIKRLVRENDFRASGSGSLIYNKEEIPIECIKVAFEVHSQLKAQAMAYDFIFNKVGKPSIVEISYGYTQAAYDVCDGYWDRNLNWFSDKLRHEGWMVELLLDHQLRVL